MLPSQRERVGAGWRSVVRRGWVVLLGMATALYIFVMMDRLNSYDPTEDDGRQVALLGGGPAPADMKVYVLVIDSLRHETAMDPTIMPNLARLRTEGVYAKVTNIVTAVTNPSIFTIFTGREDVSLLGFVKNFITPASLEVSSLFDQLRKAGVQSTVSAGTQFLQFGPVFGSYRLRDVRVPREQEHTEQQLVDAAGDLTESTSGLVVGHYPYTDYAAHQFGVGRAGYRVAFHRADALIPRIREKLPRGGTLIVIGDHGHTETGSHSLGYGLPTAAVYVGPQFCSSLNLGTIKLASNRYLLGAAFGLPLPLHGYTGELLPRALKSASGSEGKPDMSITDDVSTKRRGRTLWLWLSFGVVVALWLNVALPEWSPLSFNQWQLALAALPLGACFLPLFWVGPVTIAGGAIMMALASRRSDSLAKTIAWTVGATALGFGFHCWGAVLAETLGAQRSVSPAALRCGWALVAVACAVFGSRKNRTTFTWVLLGIPGLLLMPANSHYGWSSVAIPALLCWFILYATSVVREQRLMERPLEKRETATIALTGALMFLLVQALFSSDGIDYIFSKWFSVIPGWTTNNVVYMTVVGTVANFILFCDRPRCSSSRIAALALAVAMFPLQSRLWPTSPLAWTAVLSAALIVWLAAWRRKSVHAPAIGLWLVLAAWCYLMRPIEPNHAAICGVLAALTIGTRFARAYPQPENKTADYVFLLVVGLVAVGHALCRWSIWDLEWRAAYDWFTPAHVQQFAALVLIALIAKGLLPWSVMRRATREMSPLTYHTVQPWLRAASAVKCATVILIMTGLFSGTDVVGSYTETAQQAAVLGMLTLYVLL